jgi:hypothetical protein
MTIIWKIIYPGGTGYTNDKSFHHVMESNLANGKLACDEWTIDMVPMNRGYEHKDGVSTCLIRKSQIP